MREEPNEELRWRSLGGAMKVGMQGNSSEPCGVHKSSHACELGK